MFCSPQPVCTELGKDTISLRVRSASPVRVKEITPRVDAKLNLKSINRPWQGKQHLLPLRAWDRLFPEVNMDYFNSWVLSVEGIMWYLYQASV